MSTRLVARMSRLMDRRTSRRGFLRSLVMSATAIAFAPAYIVRPVAAQEAIITCRGLKCSQDSLCCDGWSEFCCHLTGENTCPPGTVVAGWWKVDNSEFCSRDKPRPRYYIDCNLACFSNHRCRSGGLCSKSKTVADCGCPEGCDARMVDCQDFRYGQCNDHICVGPIRCRVVTCVPPWQWDPACRSRPVLTNNRTRHHDRPCLHDWFTDIPPGAFYTSAIRWLSNQGIATGLTDDLFGPDEPMRWEDLVILLWSYGGRPDLGRPGPEFQEALLWMQLEGMETGGDSRNVTRGEIVSLLHRMAGRPQPAPKESFPAREFLSGRFPDVLAGAWYEDAVDWAADCQIIWWPTHLPFEPDRTITRAEAAVFLHRYHAPQEPPPEPGPRSSQPWL